MAAEVQATIISTVPGTSAVTAHIFSSDQITWIYFRVLQRSRRNIATPSPPLAMPCLPELQQKKKNKKKIQQATGGNSLILK